MIYNIIALISISFGTLAVVAMCAYIGLWFAKTYSRLFWAMEDMGMETLPADLEPRYGEVRQVKQLQRATTHFEARVP